jgi:hypothetical protein
VRVPDVPDPLPEPLEHIWAAGKPIVRCHNVGMGAHEFNTSAASRRFRPVTHRSAVVPTLYGADLVEGALSETVFHDVPVRGDGRRVQHKTLLQLVRSTVIPRRELRLVRLHAAGLKRLHVTHSELIESSAAAYPRTAAWGQALYDYGGFDGLVWRSRQFNDSLALMLWGDRVNRFKDLVIDEDSPPVLLYAGAGFDDVQRLADECGITVVT